MSKYLKTYWLYEKPWYKPGKWDVTHFTFCGAVRSQMPNLPKKVLPTDTTLREGVEMSGVALDIKGYLEVAKRLDDLGVKELDCGYAYKPEHRAAVKAITDSGVKCALRLITRSSVKNWEEEIDKAVKAGAKVIKIQTQGGRRWKIKARSPDYYKRLETKQVIPIVIENIKYIKDEYEDIYIQSGLTGSTQTDIEWLKEFSKGSVDAGADRVSFSDSMGVGTPPAMQYLVEQIRKVVGDADIQVHCHDDFGLAVANTIGAVQGGCTSFDCTLNGLGDRSGNASLEECIVALELLYGVETGINMEKLYQICTWMEKKSGVKMQRNKAITGENTFMEESEGHIMMRWLKEKLGLTDEWFLPYSPSLVGQTHTAVWGSTSLGGEAIQAKLENMGLSFTDKDVEDIQKRTWKALEGKASGKSWITDTEFEKIVKETLKKE